MYCSELLTRYEKNQSGSFAVVFALILLVFILVIGVAVDTNFMQRKKSNMQNIADAAVLAAARSGETELTQLTDIARQYVAANNTSGETITTTVALTDNGRININVQGQYDTQFMSIFGKSTVGVAAGAQAPLSANEPVNITLVLDTTGSMGEDANGSGGTKLEALKVAANNLIDTLDVFEPGLVEISVVPFDRYVNVGTASRGASWLEVADDGAGNGTWRGCVGSRFTPWHLRVQHGSTKITGLMNTNCGQEILPLTADMNSVRNAINSLTAQGWTYIPSGLMWGWRTLDSRQPLTQAAGGAANESDIVILMTDGANTRSKTGLRHNGWNVPDANGTTANLCTDVKSANVEIYTIAFEVTDAPTRNLLRNCASASANYYDAANAGQLDEAFNAIAQNLIRLRLTN